MPGKYNVCVVGLGSMGMGVARSCIAAGLQTAGVDLDLEKCKALVEAGAVDAGAVCKDAENLDALVLLVVNAKQCKAVLFGENGFANRMKPGAVVMVSSTISAADAKEIASGLEQKGLLVLDAPVSGGAAKANTGDITVMAAGKKEAFDRLKPVLDAVAGKVYNIGEEIGLGATVKIIHQLLAGVHIAAGAEAMALAARANIPLDVMYDVVTHAAGNSWMFENRMKHVVDGDYTAKSAVDIFVKDLRLVSETGLALNFPLPLASTAYTMFANASNAGFGKLDDSAVIKTFSGVKLPEKDV
ncbi:MAG: NAD(P)-dependent oxidoreductase [Bartonella sp.]|nr:NAD(P)-dependent oxidoreductase [Bartonella sp.]